MKFKERTLKQLAELICGDGDLGFTYRSSSVLSDFFIDCETDYRHDGSTRWRWTAETLAKILEEPQTDSEVPPDTFLRIIDALMDKGDALNSDPARTRALASLNAALGREGLEAYYGEDDRCYLRNSKTKAPFAVANPHRPFSPVEVARRNQLSSFLDRCSEDDLIEQVLLPLFRQLGFHRVTASGHKDKALEYGKDIWMRYRLPTHHLLYFGLQVKKGKLDSAGMTKGSNANIAEVYHQLTMMIGHEIFDPETSRKALVDHCIIVAGGEITKQAKNWIGERLDATKRSQILFMDREDILNLYVASGLPLPADALPPPTEETDDVPF